MLLSNNHYDCMNLWKRAWEPVAQALHLGQERRRRRQKQAKKEKREAEEGGEEEEAKKRDDQTIIPTCPSTCQFLSCVAELAPSEVGRAYVMHVLLSRLNSEAHALAAVKALDVRRRLPAALSGRLAKQLQTANSLPPPA